MTLIECAQEFEHLMITNPLDLKSEYQMQREYSIRVTENLIKVGRGDYSVVYTDGTNCLKLARYDGDYDIFASQYNQPTQQEIDETVNTGVIPKHFEGRTLEQLKACLPLLYRTEKGYASIQPLAQRDDGAHYLLAEMYTWYDNHEGNAAYYEGKPVIIDWE